MSSNRHQLLSAVYLVLEQDGEILLLRRYNTGFEDGNYALVAGHIDENETAFDAMVREASEEAGIQLDRSSLELVHTLHRQGSDNDYLDLFIRATRWEGEIRNMEPEKCDDINWFDTHNLPDNIVIYIGGVLEHINNRTAYSEYGWEN